MVPGTSIIEGGSRAGTQVDFNTISSLFRIFNTEKFPPSCNSESIGI